MKINIPEYAKQEAKKGLELRKSLPRSKQYGLTEEEAEVLGIKSGVERAKQIIKNNYLTKDDAKRIVAFYSRFKKCDTPKCKGSIKLWGGRKFGKKLTKKLRRVEK